MDHTELAFLERVNRILQDVSVCASIDSIADRVFMQAARTRDSIAWETVPLEIYSNLLPTEIRSSWVFLLREGSVSGAERHPNSHQRVRSWRGNGDFQVWNQDRWESHFLKNVFDVALEQQWASIPANIWHQAVVPPGEPWIVLSFHTAHANQLIEERPDPADSHRFHQRFYAQGTTNL